MFRGIVKTTPDDPRKLTVRPGAFFYMDETDPTKVSKWFGAVGPATF